MRERDAVAWIRTISSGTSAMSARKRAFMASMSISSARKVPDRICSSTAPASASHAPMYASMSLADQLSSKYPAVIAWLGVSEAIRSDSSPQRRRSSASSAGSIADPASSVIPASVPLSAIPRRKETLTGYSACIRPGVASQRHVNKG